MKLRTGFLAGVLGAIILMVLLYLMQATGLGGPPGFVSICRAIVGARPPLDHILGAVGFVFAGGIWGLIFAALFRNPSVIKGMAYGLAPNLFLWLVISPAMGQGFFNGFTARGIVMPLIFNNLIWGGFVGWYCGRADKKA